MVGRVCGRIIRRSVGGVLEFFLFYFIHKNGPGFAQVAEDAQGFVEGTEVFFQIGPEQAVVAEKIQTAHIGAGFGGELDFHGVTQFDNNIFGAADEIKTLLDLLIANSVAGLFAEANGTVIEHKLQLFGGGGKDFGFEVFRAVFGFWIHRSNYRAA